MADPVFISSRENPLVKELRKLVQDNSAYRKAGRFWVEGEHLCGAALVRGLQPLLAVFSERVWAQAAPHFVAAAPQVVVLKDALFADISGLESPAGMGFLLPLAQGVLIQARADTVVLDRIQDAGNVGSILRSAAAFGFHQVLALKGSVALWSPKVLRAGMGAHFGLSLVEGLALDDLDSLQLPLVVTSSHQGEYIHELVCPRPCAWVMGHEGQGVSAQLMARAAHFARIAQPGGEESLNVAAAAAICLHASSMGGDFRLGQNR